MGDKKKFCLSAAVVVLTVAASVSAQAQLVVYSDVLGGQRNLTTASVNIYVAPPPPPPSQGFNPCFGSYMDHCSDADRVRPHSMHDSWGNVIGGGSSGGNSDPYADADGDGVNDNGSDLNPADPNSNVFNYD